MHIPDGVLSDTVAFALVAGSAAAVGLAARRARRDLEEREAAAPIMGVMGAFIFAAQMVTIPLFPLPVSGHLVGGLLAAAVLGPATGILVMACVFIVQALLFQDGGLVALGANVWNGGVVPAVLGYALFAGLRRRVGRGAAAVAAAVAGVTAGALFCGLEILVSHRELGPGVVLALVGYHVPVGALEGAATAAVLGYVARVRPDLLEARVATPDEVRRVVIPLLVASALIAGGLSYAASELPDPLDATIAGTPAGEAAAAPAPAPLPDYRLPGLSSDLVSNAVAGLAGTAVVALALFAASRWLRRVRPAGGPSSPTGARPAPPDA